MSSASRNVDAESPGSLITGGEGVNEYFAGVPPLARSTSYTVERDSPRRYAGTAWQTAGHCCPAHSCTFEFRNDRLRNCGCESLAVASGEARLCRAQISTAENDRALQVIYRGVAGDVAGARGRIRRVIIDPGLSRDPTTRRPWLANVISSARKAAS